MMDIKVEESIKIMAEGASLQKIYIAIEEWDSYFQKLEIEPDRQLEEFNAIIQARLMSGIVSVAAPSLDELFGTHRCKCFLVDKKG